MDQCLVVQVEWQKGSRFARSIWVGFVATRLTDQRHPTARSDEGCLKAVDFFINSPQAATHNSISQFGEGKGYSV